MPAFDPRLNPLNGVPTGDQISLGELLAKAGGALGLYGPHALGLGQFLEGPANALGLTGTPVTDTLNAQTDQRYNQLLGALHGGPPASAPTMSSVFGNPLLAGLGMNADMIDAWHGTPHTFSPTPSNPLGEFKNEAIGTGEGAQAYGYGHYVAGNPRVASDYQHKLANYDPNTVQLGDQQYKFISSDQRGELADALANQGIPRDSALMAAHTLAEHKGDIVAATAAHAWEPEGTPDNPMRQQVVKALDMLKPVEIPGHMLNVQIKPDEHELLDWDKPMTEQTPDIQAKIRAMPGYDTKAQYINTGTNMGDLYKRGLLPDSFSSERASAALNAAGIPGIKYLDQGSRNAYAAQPVTHVGARYSPMGQIRVTGYKPNPNGGFDTVSQADMSKDMIQTKFGSKVTDTLQQGLNDRRETRIPLDSPTDLATRNYVIFDPSNLTIRGRGATPEEAKAQASQMAGGKLSGGVIGK